MQVTLIYVQCTCSMKKKRLYILLQTLVHYLFELSLLPMLCSNPQKYANCKAVFVMLQWE